LAIAQGVRFINYPLFRPKLTDTPTELPAYKSFLVSGDNPLTHLIGRNVFGYG